MRAMAPQFHRLTALISFLCLLCAACGHKHQRLAKTPNAPARGSASHGSASAGVTVPVGYAEEGVASWYGVPYNGRPAADGEIYDMETLVAAHRLMPFNTWVKVTNLANGKSVDVRIIDRGPFVRGRLIDLSKAAARQIDLLGPGVGRVRIEVISAPTLTPADDLFAVQVGAFSAYANAESLRESYARHFGNAELALKQGAKPMWRVLVGKEPSIEAAQQLAIVLAAQDKNVFVVRLDASAQTASSQTQGPVN